MMWNAPGRYAGLSGTAEVNACSSGRVNDLVTVFVGHGAPGGLSESHSQAYRASIPVFEASSSGVMAPTPAIAR
jgi:hypothetical protein